jgi:hypothetical protein
LLLLLLLLLLSCSCFVPQTPYQEGIDDESPTIPGGHDDGHRGIIPWILGMMMQNIANDAPCRLKLKYNRQGTHKAWSLKKPKI